MLIPCLHASRVAGGCIVDARIDVQTKPVETCVLMICITVPIDVTMRDGPTN